MPPSPEIPRTPPPEGGVLGVYPSPRAPRRLLLLNTAANFAGKFGTKALALLAVPWLLHYLGPDRWAVYGMGLAVMVLATLLDPGPKYGYVKVFAECLASGRRADLVRLAGAGFVLYAGVSLAYSLLVRLGIGWILTLTGVSADLRGEAAFFFSALVASVFLTETFSVFRHLQIAAQRMARANALQLAGSLLHYGGIFAVIVLDGGLRGLGWVFLASALAQGLLYASGVPAILRAAPGGVPPRPFRELLGYLFHFGWRLKVAANCDTLVFHLDKVFVSRFAGFQAAGTYQIASTLGVVLREFVKLWVSALLPAATALAVEGGLDRMREVNRLASRWFLALSTPVFLLTSALAPLILHAWIGRPVPGAAAALTLLALGCYAHTATAAAAEVGAACHLPHLQMRSALLAAGANFLLVLPCVRLCGASGVPLASLLALALGSLWYARLLTRALGDSLGGFLKDACLKPFAAAGLPALALGFFGRPWAAQAADRGRGAALAALVVLALSYLFAYAVLLLASGHLKRRDRQALARFL